MSDDPFDLAAKLLSAPPADPGGRLKRTDEGRASDEASYVCDACGEEIVVPADVAAGARQEYVEDCPVCCRPWQVTVRYAGDGSARVELRSEDEA